MAHGAVGARTEGDTYQGLFFWKKAAELLHPPSMVDRVILEHDLASGVDDVAVYYRDPGIDAGGWQCFADFYQIKYHVDHRDGYSATNLIDPAFISSEHSLLQSFFKANERLIASGLSAFRLHLATNWRWKDDDKLAASINDTDGALRPEFFTVGPRSVLGKIREAWRNHLNLDAGTFAKFAKRLRFDLNHFGRRQFKELVNLRLQVAGLVTPPADRSVCPYDSLVQQFLMSGPNEFNRDQLLEICSRERLLLPVTIREPNTRLIGVRSFMRFAEHIEADVNEFTCIARLFDGRMPSAPSAWRDGATAIVDFVGEPDRRARFRDQEHAVLLECHSSFALLFGYEVSRNSGALVFAAQKTAGGTIVWRPTQVGGSGDAKLWTTESAEMNADADDIAVAISVTRDVKADVLRFLSRPGAPLVRSLVCLAPAAGVGPTSVRDADHAVALADTFVAHLRQVRGDPFTRVHLFASCPNGLSFLIGQHREALGRLVLYEFDFGLERDGSYLPSLVLPFKSESPDGTS